MRRELCRQDSDNAEIAQGEELFERLRTADQKTQIQTPARQMALQVSWRVCHVPHDPIFPRGDIKDVSMSDMKPLIAHEFVRYVHGPTSAENWPR